MAEMKVFTLLSEINALMGNSKRVPLKNNLIVLDRTRMEELLDRLEQSLDPDLKNAEKLLARERELLDNVEKRAREISEKADREAQETTERADREAKQALDEARSSAENTLRQSTDQANRMLSDAQNQANQMIAAAQNQAAQMVEEDEITQRARARASELEETARQECDRLRQETMGTLSQLLEHADIGLGAQLDALRTMRQQLGAAYADAQQNGYGGEGYSPDDGYQR